MGDYERFLERYPAYLQGGDIAALRAAEFGRLDDAGHVYLDYTGAGCTPRRRCGST